MRERWLRRALVAALVLTLAAAVGAGWFAREISTPYRGWDGTHVDVAIEPGVSANRVLRRLGEAGVLKHPWVLRVHLAVIGGGAELQAGEYRFDEPARPLQVLDRLRRGDVILYSVTVPEGLTRRAVASRIAEAGLADEETLAREFENAARVRDWDPHADDLEGYLFPDTYRFSRSAGAERIADTLVDHFRRLLDDGYAKAAERVGLTVREAVTLASMIEKETSVAAERRRISAVFHNRLARSMPMQCDPTVLYAWERIGKPVARLYSKQLELDSPYNTYRYPGLPPGPIANPGRASLEAAVDPLETRELYFVAQPGGGHAFSETLDEHNRAVRRWRAYVRSSR